MVSSFEEGTCHPPIFLLCVPIILLASKCLACQLSTPGIDIHSQQNLKSPQLAYPSRMVYPSNAPFQKLYHYGVWVIFQKKTTAEAMKKKRQDPYLHSKELK